MKVDSFLQGIHALSELFKVGLIIPCMLTETVEEGKKLQLSINPYDVNEDVQVSNLCNGMVSIHMLLGSFISTDISIDNCFLLFCDKFTILLYHHIFIPGLLNLRSKEPVDLI